MSRRPFRIHIGQPPKDRYLVVPPSTKENKNTVVYLLLNAGLIEGTLQLRRAVLSTGKAARLWQGVTIMPEMVRLTVKHRSTAL